MATTKTKMVRIQNVEKRLEENFSYRLQRLSFRLDGCVARASGTITMGMVSESRGQSHPDCVEKWKAVLWAVGSRQSRKRTPGRERRGRRCWQVRCLLDKSSWKQRVKDWKQLLLARYHFS